MLQDVRLGVEQSQLQVKALKQHISTALSQTETIDMARLRNTTTTHSPLAFADQVIYPKKCSAQVPASHAHFATLAHRLHCPTDCACRCHTPFTQHTVPSILASLIGQINVSKRLLHTLRLSSWECNTQTCRRDKTVSDTVHWCLPFALFHSDWSMHVNLPSLSISIFAPRTIPPNAEAWKYIYTADLVGLRALFTARKASIYDVDEYGNTFLAVRILSKPLYATTDQSSKGGMPSVEPIAVTQRPGHHQVPRPGRRRPRLQTRMGVRAF